MWGGGPSCGAWTSRTGWARGFLRPLRAPGLPAGVPADEAVAGDQDRDALEERAVLGRRAVDRELRDAVRLPHDRDARPLCLVRLAGLGAEDEVGRLGEEDSGPGVARLLVQRHDDLA